MFPEVHQTFRFDLIRHRVIGKDENDADVFGPDPVMLERPCRKYRDRALEATHVRQGKRVDAVIQFRWREGDLILSDDEMLVYRLDRGIRTDVHRMNVVYPNLQDGLAGPLHWEVLVQEVAAG